MFTKNQWGFSLSALVILAGCGSDGSGSTSTSGSGGSGGGTGGSGGSGGSSVRCAVDAPAEPAVAATDAGLVRGQKEGETWVFRGIPFAAPPVGDLRFRPPEVAACWEGVRDTLAFGAKCSQNDEKLGTPIGAEDCLTLNVWAPDVTTPDTAPMPVLFFIHGGGNIQGASSQELPGGAPIYNGLELSKAGSAVVVTVNYRLGPFGYLALPELAAESSWGGSGNFGILDQIAALEWVQKNIAAFGGDPSNVLVFGESAGGVNTTTLVASPLAKGLFHAAIVESGGSTSTPQKDAEGAMAARVDQSSCGSAADRLACLRGKTPEELLAELGGSVGIGGVVVGADPSKYGPVIDGHVLPKATLAILQAGEHNHVPFAIGTNSEELVKMMTVTVGTEAEFQAIVNTSFGALAPQILAAYPVLDYATPQDALVALYSDMRFNCPARSIARAIAGAQTEPVYRYFFTRRAPTPQGANPAAHAVELLYVFNTLTDIPLYSPVADDLGLSQAMMGYWTRFAATKDPNGMGAAVWPAYDAAKDTHIVLDAPISMGEGVRTAQCDMWGTLLGTP